VRAAGFWLILAIHRPIAEVIRYLLTHDAEAEAMGRRGRQAVEEQFNWTREECKLLAFYGSLTHLRHSGSGAIGKRVDP